MDPYRPVFSDPGNRQRSSRNVRQSRLSRRTRNIADYGTIVSGNHLVFFRPGMTDTPQRIKGQGLISPV